MKTKESSSDCLVQTPFAKLVFDKTLAIIALIFTLPINLVIIIAIIIDGVLHPNNRGNLFYKEERVSQGKIFTLFKFRILKNLAIEQIQSGVNPKDVENAPNTLTQVGFLLKKFGLDELPQLFNILKGEMSFVGPRPKPVSEYEEEIAKGIFRRKVIIAGLTGPAQILKGTKRTLDDELNADLDYIEMVKLSPPLKLLIFDLRVVAKTIKVLLKGTGE